MLRIVAAGRPPAPPDGGDNHSSRMSTSIRSASDAYFDTSCCMPSVLARQKTILSDSSRYQSVPMTVGSRIAVVGWLRRLRDAKS